MTFFDRIRLVDELISEDPTTTIGDFLKVVKEIDTEAARVEASHQQYEHIRTGCWLEIKPDSPQQYYRYHG